ncbi:AP2-like ethylene-responsive transcription factor CRL5 [Wolffia australiana]
MEFPEDPHHQAASLYLSETGMSYGNGEETHNLFSHLLSPIIPSPPLFFSSVTSPFIGDFSYFPPSEGTFRASTPSNQIASSPLTADGVTKTATAFRDGPKHPFGHRTSQYRGVTRHRWTGRFEAHLWDSSIRKEGQARKGRQGGYASEEKAARAYDLASLKYWGSSACINFPLESYAEELEEMKNMTRPEYVAHLRSSGFSRGASMYRGVTRHHQHGRWQARIGRVAGNKDLYLGTFGTEEDAAEAYDVAAIRFRGLSAVTNFNISRYDVEKITNSRSPIVPTWQGKRGSNRGLR